MAEINANIVVQPIELSISANTPGITVEPPPQIGLNVFTSGYAQPGGDPTQLQYNLDGQNFDGISNTSFVNGNLTLGNVGNVKILGGNNAFFLQTDGSGNLTWAQGTANVSGNGTADGANGLIQLSDGTGNFRSGSGFSFDTGTNALAVPGDVVSAGDFSGVDGNLSGNIIANNITANGIFTGDGGNLSNIPAGNLVGNIITSDNITANNITANGIFTGNASGLTDIPAGNLVGNIVTSENITANNITANGIFSGDGGNLSNIPAGNLNGDIITSGNITANFYLGNGAFLTGIDTASISNGNSNVRVFANANITISANGIANVIEISETQFQINETISIQQAKEKVVINANSVTGTINYDILDQAILYYTGNSSNNYTINFRGNSTVTLDNFMNNNQSITLRFINTNGNTPYYANNFQIDGSNITPFWPQFTGAPVAGLTNGKDIYDFEIIKISSNTYAVFGIYNGFI